MSCDSFGSVVMSKKPNKKRVNEAMRYLKVTRMILVKGLYNVSEEAVRKLCNKRGQILE